MEEEIKGSGDDDSTERAQSRSDVTAVLHEDRAPIVLRSVVALMLSLTLLLLSFNFIICHFTKQQSPKHSNTDTMWPPAHTAPLCSTASKGRVSVSSNQRPGKLKMFL